MTPDFMREGEEPEMQTIDLPDVGSSPRNLGQSPAPRQVVPTFDSGEGATPTGTMASLREQFPKPKTAIDYSGLQAALSGKKTMPPEPDFVDRGYSDTNRIVDSWNDEARNTSYAPPRRNSDVYNAIMDHDERQFLAQNAAEKQDAADRQAISASSLPMPERPQVSPPASGSMGDPSVRAASKVPATPGAPDPTAMATPGSTTSPAVMSQYEALKRAFAGGGGDEPDYSGVVRGAEDVYAALANKKADYRVADEMAADRKARAAAPMRKLAQEQMLEQVRQAETPLPDSYLDQLGAPHGLNKAQLKEFLDRRETVASIKQKEREPREEFKSKLLGIVTDPRSTPDQISGAYELLNKMGEYAPATKSAEIRGKSAVDIQQMKNDLAQKKLDLLSARGEAADKLKRDIAKDEIALGYKRVESQERVTGARMSAAAERDQKNRDEREDVEARKSVPPDLSDALSAINNMQSDTSVASFNDVAWWSRLLRAIPFGAGENFVEPEQLAVMNQQDALAAFQTRLETGLNMTDDERRSARSRFGQNVFANPVVFKEMLKFYQGLADNRVAQKQAGLSYRALTKLQEGGGYVSPKALAAAAKYEGFEPPSAAMPAKRAAAPATAEFAKPPAGKVFIYDLSTGARFKYDIKDDADGILAAESDPAFKVVR